LISTRNNGKIKYEYPYSHFFNYVIILALVDGENVLADATEVSCLNNRIPPRCINDKGLVIRNKDEVEWTDLKVIFPSETKTDILIEIINNEIINTSISISSSEYDALYHRNNYGEKIETVKENLVSKDYSIFDSTISILNQFNLEEPYLLSYIKTSKPEIVNEKIYLSPFPNELISENPLKQKERTYPIDMTYPIKRVYSTTILIPENYQVDFLPEDKKINNELFELTYKVDSNDKQINILFEFYFKNSIYASSNYSKIKYYFRTIAKKGNEKIVLLKSLTVEN
jgi:hypothetical protein